MLFAMEPVRTVPCENKRGREMPSKERAGSSQEVREALEMIFLDLSTEIEEEGKIPLIDICDPFGLLMSEREILGSAPSGSTRKSKPYTS